MGCRVMGRRPTFIAMMLLTTIYFLVEIVVGYLTNSMALLADSFHMLSDIISLVVGFFALTLSRKASEKLADGSTFKWVRAEVLGALVNAVFLIALCLSILNSALKRLVETEEIRNPILILIVGTVGLIVNLIGMVLFHGHAGGAHGHSHLGGHGHSHLGGHGHSHVGAHRHSHGDVHGHNHGSGHSHGSAHKRKKHGDDTHEHAVIKDKYSGCETKNGHVLTLPGFNMEAPASPSMRRFQERTKRVEVILNADVENGVVVTEECSKIHVTEEKHPSKSEGQLNMKGVYLHILGDALGSIIVIISALIVEFVRSKWTLYVDPVMSILMVLIILYSTIPLLKESGEILLKNAPSPNQLKQLEVHLLNKFPEIMSNANHTRLLSTLNEFFQHSPSSRPEDSQDSHKQNLSVEERKSIKGKIVDEEVLTNVHATPANEIHITINDESFHMEDDPPIQTIDNCTDDAACSSPKRVSICCTPDDNILTNEHTESIDNVSSVVTNCCSNSMPT